MFRRLILTCAALLLNAALICPASALTLTPVASGLASPVYVVSDGTARLYIVEQAGTIRILDGTTLLPTPFLDVSAIVTAGGEQGLLGLAFHPNYAANGRFFIFFTDRSGALVVAEFRRSADPNLADPATGSILLRISHPRFGNHNGGQLAFGPDGFLYISTGDGGGGVRTSNGRRIAFGGRNAQSLRSLLGKILRIDVDRGPPYMIPADNPFVRVRRARGEIWALGFRNPWRFSFDSLTGVMVAGDVGANTWEEIDAVFPGGNYGWSVLEGAHCFSSRSCRASRYLPPLFEYPHIGARAAVIGGHIYRGSAAPSLTGSYIFGDFGSGEVFAIRPDASGNWSGGVILQAEILLSAIGRDNVGELYLVDLRGSIYRLGE